MTVGSGNRTYSYFTLHAVASRDTVLLAMHSISGNSFFFSSNKRTKNAILVGITIVDTYLNTYGDDKLQGVEFSITLEVEVRVQCNESIFMWNFYTKVTSNYFFVCKPLILLTKNKTYYWSRRRDPRKNINFHARFTYSVFFKNILWYNCQVDWWLTQNVAN